MALSHELSGTSRDADFTTFEHRQKLNALIMDMESWAGVIPVFGNLKNQLDHINMQVVKSKVLPPGLTLLCSRDFLVLPEPKQHNYSHFIESSDEDESGVSHALHHVDEFEYLGHKVWLHDLAAGKHTSKHTHGKVEIQRVLYGKIIVNDQIIYAGQTHVVQPGSFHSAKTIDQPAIMLCTLMDGAGEKKDDVHKF